MEHTIAPPAFGSSRLWLLLLLILTFYVIHRVCTYFCGNFHIFRDQGVPGPRPVPVFGTWCGSWNQNTHEIDAQHHEKYGKIYCTFRGRTPVLHVHDLTLLRSIYIKDSAEHFGQRHRRPVNGENEYVNKTMSMLHGSQWRTLRNLVISAFSPAVVKQRVEFADKSLVQFVDAWKETSVASGVLDLREETEVLCEEIMMNYCVGAKLGTLGQPDHPFVVNARKTMEAGERSFIGTLTQLYPQLLQWLGPLMGIETGNEYFVNLSKRILNERAANDRSTTARATRPRHHITDQPDLVDRLLACLNGDNIKGQQHIDHVVAVAQISSTILTGYDMGTVLTRVLHCLTMHPEIQEQCRKEIGEEMKRSGSEVSFSMLADLPYVEQCIREALRLYPTFAITYRLCTKNKQYPNLFIPKGTTVECPIYLLQRDPELYPDPLKYNPDRFAPENARQRDPFLFMSFGQGQRGCFAQKFTMLVLKHCLVHLLSTFEFFPVAQTKDPISFTTGPAGTLTARDMFVGIKLLDECEQ